MIDDQKGMGFVDEFLSFLPEETRKAILARDPERPEYGVYRVLTVMHLIPPSQLRAMIKIDPNTGDVEYAQDLAEDIDDVIQDLAERYHKFLDPESKKEIAFLGWQRLMDTVQRKWNAEYKDKKS